ncbi:MAG: hypothetical protein ACI4OU_03940 [Candidatus Enterenecus sp.]
MAGTIVGTLVGGSSTVGILSVFIGDYMRSDFPDMSAGQAFSRFLAEQLPRGPFLPFPQGPAGERTTKNTAHTTRSLLT